MIAHEVERDHSAPSAPDRKSTRLNSSHRCISYAVFCLKKKNLCVIRGRDHVQVNGRDRTVCVSPPGLLAVHPLCDASHSQQRHHHPPLQSTPHHTNPPS